MSDRNRPTRPAKTGNTRNNAGARNRANSSAQKTRTTVNRVVGKADAPNKESSNRRVKGGGAPLAVRLTAYFAHHKDSALEAFQRLLRAPSQTLPTCLVIAIALALPTLFYLFLNNIDGQANRWQSPAQISVYLHKRANPGAVEALRQSIDQRGDVETSRFISPAQALIEFQKSSGFTDVLSSLDDNPLPAVIVITPRSLSIEAMSMFTQELAAHSAVESVQLDLEWVQRLQQIMVIAGRLASVLTLLLAMGVVLIVGNVIRLAIANRKEEIIIAKLVGASNGFVRRPFLYTGLAYGVLGGILAVIMVAAAAIWLSGPVARLAALYAADFELQGLGFGGASSLVFGAAVLGSVGAWLSVSRHLAAIRPS